MWTESSTSLQVRLSENSFLTHMFLQPLPSVTVSVLSEKETKSDQTPPDKPYDALSKSFNCHVSAQSKPAGPYVRHLLMLGQFWAFNANDYTSRAEIPALRLAEAGG